MAKIIHTLAYGGTLDINTGNIEDDHILSYTCLPENKPIFSNNQQHIDVPMSYRRVIYPSKTVVDNFLRENPDLSKVVPNRRPVIRGTSESFTIRINYPTSR